jgi:type IV pilus assembly protein PilN
MIEINLLPLSEIREKEKKRFKISISLLLTSLAILVCVYLKWTANRKEHSLDENIARINEEIKKLDLLLKEVAQLKNEKEALEKRLKVAETLEKGRLEAALIMMELSKRVPEKLWLEGLEKKGESMKCNGIALDEETIADFMTALKGSPYIKKVELESVTKHSIGGVDLKKFILTCEFRMD